MKDQFRITRRELIEKSKELLAKRNLLKGLRGVNDQWDELTKELVETQEKINRISKALGLPVLTNFHTQPKGTKRGTPYKQVKKNQKRINLDRQRKSLEAQDRKDADNFGNK